jgi:ParB-like chromosome segregation protein Spo0J
MRAEAHYVDQLGAASGAQPLRMVDVDQLATAHTSEPADLRALVESIRAHGIVHPLLVARRDQGYEVIAGHKRLAAARMLRLDTVPCFVHSVDEPRAALLAQADNLHTLAPERRDDMAARSKAIRQAIADHLAAVHAGAPLTASSSPHLGRAAIDLLNAHSWRAARLVDVLDVDEKRPSRAVRPAALASVVDRVVEGFASEGRLSGVEVHGRIDGAVAGATVDRDETALIVSSGVLATLPLVDHTCVDRPTILVTASNGSAGHVRVAIEQQSAPVSATLAARFFDRDYNDRSGGWCAVACASAVKMVGERIGAGVAFGVDSYGYSRLTVDLPRV